MIEFFSETDFSLEEPNFYKEWIQTCVEKEKGKIEVVNVIFCDNEYLLEINKKHLNHNYYTDIITFDYSESRLLSGDIFISIDCVADNAYDFETDFENELARVIIHGFLHLLGYNDKTDEDQGIMTQKEDYYLSMRYHSENDDDEE